MAWGDDPNDKGPLAVSAQDFGWTLAVSPTGRPAFAGDAIDLTTDAIGPGALTSRNCDRFNGLAGGAGLQLAKNKKGDKGAECIDKFPSSTAEPYCNCE